MTNETRRAIIEDRFEHAARQILTGALPVPVRERWQPLRAGLMNVFLFEDERFPFADGRLLLRGTNGTGKSRVLAMTLPLLLDGSFKATRVEPDRDHNRQVSWNILMDEQESATGYSWLEFGRLAGDASGDNGSEVSPDQYLTIGCGMRAKRGQSIKPWFFITQRRVDDSLVLKSTDGIPLTQRQLAEELGACGQVYDVSQKSDYRRAVDEQLFRLGDRYDALIELLLQLRQPKLAEKLDIDGLEATLREALPPLQESLLNDAADAFLELDQYRTSLESDRSALQHIQKFLKPYRDHVRRGVKRSLKQLTSANSRYETAQRKLRDLAEEKEQGTTRLEQLETQRGKLKIEILAGQTAIAELQRSPEIQNAQRIDELAEDAKRLNKQVEQFTQDAARAAEDLANAEERQKFVSTETSRQQNLVMQQSDHCRETAAPEALQNQHQEFIATCLTLENVDQFPSRKAKTLRRVETYVKSAQHLTMRNKELEAANTKLSEINANAQRLEHTWQEKTVGLSAAQTHYNTTREELWTAIAAWYGRAAVLRTHFPSIETWAEQFDAWPAESAETDPSPRILDQAKSKSIAELIVKQEELRHETAQRKAQIELLQDEVERLESGEPIKPPVRAHRTSADEAEQEQGIPFWSLIDFHPDVPEPERGNWEAALHDAGLLDARVTADGRLVGMDRSSTSVQLASVNMQPMEESRQLARVLKLSEDFHLTRQRGTGDAPSSTDRSAYEESLSDLLTVIGVGHNAGETWVAADGRWRNGPLHGKLTKEHAQYIGEEARTRWQQTRLRELADDIGRLETEIAQLDERSRLVETTKAQIHTLVSEFSSSQPLVDATISQISAQKEADESSAHLEAERESEVRQRKTFEALKRTRDDEAADFGLSAWADRSDELGRRLDQYVSQLDTLDARVDAFSAALDRQREADSQAQRARQHIQSCRKRLDATKAEFGQAEEKVRVLRDSIGKDVEQMLKTLESERRAQEQRDNDAELLMDALTRVKTELAVTDNNVEQREAESGEFDRQRREATEDFAELDRHGLLSLIADQTEIPTQPWAMTAAIRLARQVDNLLQNVPADEETWLASQTRLHRAQTELQQTVLLQDGLTIEVAPLRDGLQMVSFALQGERLAPTTAAARIESEIATRERILDEREQDTLEKYLLGEVADGLRKGIAMARDLVEQMTAEVSKRPMKTGMQMRFRWRQHEEGPPGLTEACEVLSVDSATWSPEERDQIKLFLQRAIRQQREEDETGSWHEHMRAALDYRRWHRILIERRKGPGANWIRLTRKTYAGGSGGEKAIALTLPPIAAAAAYYQTADTHAPRFILLDEAFAGISSDNRESCMELIVDFGLDAVLTSENEWGMYPGVPQLAICQLDRFSDLRAVVNRVFVWNGKQRRTATPREQIDDALLSTEN